MYVGINASQNLEFTFIVHGGILVESPVFTLSAFSPGNHHYRSLEGSIRFYEDLVGIPGRSESVI